MIDDTALLIIIFAWVCGVGVGYIVWAPETRNKRAFLDGLSLKFIWGRWMK